MMKRAAVTLAAVAVALVGTLAPASPASAHGPTIIQYGDQTSNVQCVQSGLNIADNAGLAVDGIFGPATLSAVESFQAGMGLTVDGIVGPQTGGWLIQTVNGMGMGPYWTVSFGTFAGSRCHELDGTAFVGHY